MPANTIDKACCGSGPVVQVKDGGPLPADPLCSVRYNYGMLLGEEDFVADQAYHRGKHRLHGAWLHGAGVVWGLEVSLPQADDGTPTGDLQVGRGLALDPLGEELVVDRPWCVDVGQWLTVHRNDPDFVPTSGGGAGDDNIVFDAHVVVCFRTCLARPVPAMVDPCRTTTNGGADVACSRTVETVRLELRPGKAPAPPDPPSPSHHLLRILFGLDAPSGTPTGAETTAAARRAAVLAASDLDTRTSLLLAAFREMAALDTLGWAADAAAAPPLFPSAPEPCVALADVTDLTLDRDGDGWTLVSGTVDATVRPALVPTDVVQELLCGLFGDAAGGAGGTDGGGAGGGSTFTDTDATTPYSPASDAGGPRVDRTSVRLLSKAIAFQCDGHPLKESLLDPGAVVVTTFDSTDGWKQVPVTGITSTIHGGRSRVRVKLEETPAGDIVRLFVRGTGPRPVMSRAGAGPFVPLAGEVGGPPTGPFEGRDFVHMMQARS